MSLSTHIVHTFFSQDYVASNGQPSVAIGVGMTVNGKLAAFSYAAETGAYSENVWSTTLAAETPHHVALATGSGYLGFYVNGVVNPPTTAASVPGKASSCAIGGVFVAPNSPRNQLNSHRVSLGQFAFWNRTLSSYDVDALYIPGRGSDVAARWEWEVARLNEVLDYVSWPVSWRTGMHILGVNGWTYASDPSTKEWLVPPKWDNGTTVLELLQKAANAVDGALFVGADGNIVYQIRSARQGLVPFTTFRETDSTQIDADFAYQIDDNDIINKVSVTAANGLAFEWKDAASIAIYGERDKSADWDLLSAADLLHAAARVVNRRKVPLLRCPTITVDVAAADDAANIVFDIELGTTVALDDLPPTAPADIIRVIVESISWDIDATTGDWKVTYEVSPGSMYTHITLDTDAGGVLDSNTLGDS